MNNLSDHANTVEVMSTPDGRTIRTWTDADGKATSEVCRQVEKSRSYRLEVERAFYWHPWGEFATRKDAAKVAGLALRLADVTGATITERVEWETVWEPC